jgi:hypothetical protein
MGDQGCGPERIIPLLGSWIPLWNSFDPQIFLWRTHDPQIFFWPFKGEYRVILLGKDYEYVVVTCNTMEYL